jgi:dipeptidyl aminopeptidase/acylaminoacyl peptidase
MQWILQAGLLVAAALLTLSNADVLTPERLLSAPRPGSGVANPSGSHALVGCRTFSFEKDSYDDALYKLLLPSSKDLESKSAFDEKLQIVSHNTSSGVWLTDEIVAYVDASTNTLYAKDVVSEDHNEDTWKAVGVFPAPIDTIQVSRSKTADTVTLVFSAQVYGDGDLYAVKKHDESPKVKEWNRVKVYDNTFIRHWDKWLYPGRRSQLFAIDVQLGDVSAWSFSSKARNLLKDTILEAPVPPFGDEGDYSVSETHVVFTSKDPKLSPSWHTKQNIYMVSIKGDAPPVELTKGKHGATSSPTFSPDGKRVAWLQMARDGYESDRRVIHTLDVDDMSDEVVLLQDWQLSPSSIRFSEDSKSVVGIVEDAEQEVIFEVDLRGKHVQSASHPSKLSSYGGAQSIVPLKHGALVSASSLLGPTDLYFISPHASHSKELGTKAVRLTNWGQSKGSSLAGLDLGSDPEQFSFAGANGRTSHGWIHYPPGYDKSKSYALATIIHGGPEGSFANSWSLRWNPAVFAAQDFFVITIDPAGSSGFGQAYQEEILGQWGGAPFLDIRAGVKHILKRFDNIDPERVVAAGASYGGYMVNWINGHNEDKLFKG